MPNHIEWLDANYPLRRGAPAVEVYRPEDMTDVMPDGNPDEDWAMPVSETGMLYGTPGEIHRRLMAMVTALEESFENYVLNEAPDEDVICDVHHGQWGADEDCDTCTTLIGRPKDRREHHEWSVNGMPFRRHLIADVEMEGAAVQSPYDASILIGKAAEWMAEGQTSGKVRDYNGHERGGFKIRRFPV